MNIETEITSLLKQTITQKNKQKRMHLFREIFSLNEFSNFFEGKDYNYLIKDYYTPQDYLYSKKESKKAQNIFLNTFHLERSYHQYFSSCTISNYYETPLKQCHFYFKETLSKQKFISIIIDFFKTELPEFYPYFLNLLNENQIIYLKEKDYLEKESIGLTKYLPTSKKSYIFIPLEYTLKNMITLVHEVGHTIHFNFIKDDYLSFANNYFSEIISYFFEQIFLNYLIKNNLFKEECNRYLNSLAILLYNKANHLYIISNINFTVDNLYNITTQSTEIYEQIKEHLNDNFDIYKLQNLNLRKTLLYYYGILFSYELLEQYKINRSETLKNIKNILCNKNIENLEDILEYINLDIESIASHKTLQKQIHPF